jgi:hypothetical protein
MSDREDEDRRQTRRRFASAHDSGAGQDAAPGVPGKATNTSRLAPATKVPYRGTVFPLPADIRSELEAVTKVSLAHVRVHADDEADAIANSHGTRAVAIGADIYIADGHVDFESHEGRALIAHEVAHVVQASSAGSARTEADMTIDAAEGDADRLATDFGERGTSARWQPGAAVASGTAMQAPPAGAAPREASRQPMDAPNYFSLYESKFFDAIRERLQTVALPAAHDRLQWISGSAALAAAFQPAFNAAFGFMNLGKKLPGVLYPMDPFAIIDLHRTLTSGQPGAKLDGKLPEGPVEWSVVAGRAIAIEFEGAVRAALPRMGLRYVAQADEGNGNVTFDMLVTSHPIDLVVGRMLCDPKVVRYVPESGKRTKRQMASRDTSRPDAFCDGIRLVFTEWQGDRDPRLWNYVKVEPVDARPEEVAASLYEQLDGKRHTELAYALVAAPPFYRVPPQWARQFPHAKQYAPEKDEADPASALDLADSALGDEAARAQAGKPVAHVDRAALAHGFATAKTQLQLIGELTGPWNLFHHVGPALRWVTKHAETINAAPDKTLAIWAAIVAGQSRTLTEATGEIMEVLQLADARGVRSDTPEAKPFRDVLEAFATAMGESHMQQTAVRSSPWRSRRKRYCRSCYSIARSERIASQPKTSPRSVLLQGVQRMPARSPKRPTRTSKPARSTCVRSLSAVERSMMPSSRRSRWQRPRKLSRIA